MAQPTSNLLPILPPQPSLFDLLASESLLQTTRPALKKLVQCLASLPGGGGGRGGEFRRWVTRWGDEVTLLLEIGLHYHFLRKHGASFAENFYGLRRAAGNDDEARPGLNRSAILKSVLVIVLLPYARKKMAEIYEKLCRMKDDGELDGVKGKKLIEAFLAAYPILAVCNQSSSFVYQVLYAVGKSKFHDQFEHLAGFFHLTYAPPPPPPPPTSPNKSDSLLKSSINGLLRMSSRVVSHSFSVGLFFAQFFDVFDSEGRGRSAGSDGPDPSFPSSTFDDYSQRVFKKLETLVAPPKLTGSSGHVASPQTFSMELSGNEGRPVNGQTPFSSDTFSSLSTAPSFSSFPITPVGATPLRSGAESGALCPICHRRRENETALSVSGFVFCYKCIMSYLKTHGVCPVTKLPANSNNLVRLYPGF